ncbi:MAG: (2Fe-2S)-binding protein, partial [Bacteroidales bacterium]|nr:(2Fe-2S)-binding protein [Bacteroidales bacterium]
ICTCMEVYQKEIEAAIKDKKLTTVEQVQDATGAGTVCGACVDDIQKILEQINNRIEL